LDTPEAISHVLATPVRDFFLTADPGEESIGRALTGEAEEKAAHAPLTPSERAWAEGVLVAVLRRS
jgi:hypothetical protein